MKRSASGCGEFSSTPSAKACGHDRGADRQFQIEREQQAPATYFAEAMPRGQLLQLAFQKQAGIGGRFQEIRLADVSRTARPAAHISGLPLNVPP